MGVLVNKIAACFNSKRGDSFQSATFHVFDKMHPAYWARVLSFELFQTILAVVAVSSVPESYINHFGSGTNFWTSAVVKTVIATAVNAISWPWFCANSFSVFR